MLNCCDLKAAQKISAYAKRCAMKEAEARAKTATSAAGTAKNMASNWMTGEVQASALYAVEAFLCALMNDKEGL